MFDPRQLDCYIRLKTRATTRESVVEFAISLLTENPSPAWALEISCLFSTLEEVENALTSQLFKAGILPVSPEFRRALKKAVLSEAGNLPKASNEQAVAIARKIECLFQLLPDYSFNSVSIPIVEFYYPPSSVVTPRDLQAYIIENVNCILKIPSGDKLTSHTACK